MGIVYHCFFCLFCMLINKLRKRKTLSNHELQGKKRARFLVVYGVPSVQLRVVRMLPRVLRACGTAVPKVTGRTLQKPGWRSGCGCSAAVIVVCQASNNKLCVHFFVQCSRGSKFWFCFEGLPINLLAIWKSFADPDPGPIWICFQKVLLAVFRSQSGRSLSMSHLSPRMKDHFGQSLEQN